MDAQPQPAPLPAGTVTFLLTDIVGSAALWASGGDGVADAVARHYALIDEVVAAHDGVRPIEQGEGDSTVSAFARPTDAVRAAAAIQRAMRTEPWPGGITITVRIGVHTGEAMLRDERNYFGEAITRAARIRDLAAGGQTLLSNATAALIDNEIPAGASVRDAGVHELEGLSRAERVHQLCDDEVDSGDALGPPRRTPLPAQVTSFVGRARELAELAAALQTTRVLSLVGTGGCGKTRLAIETARAAAVDVAWVDLSPLNDPALIRSAVAAALGLREAVATDDVLLAHLRGRTTLLVVDNCEHLAAECAALVDALVRGAEDLTVLATSREALGVAGELAWQVPSLDDGEAAALFVDRAAKVRPRFALTDDNAAAIASICRRLDGIPLAIELAAARARTLSPQQIADGLADRFRLLTGGARTALARQRTLEASVEWSHALLADDERVVLRRLSVFAGGFTLDAAESVCSGDGIEPLGVLDLVSALVDRSLVHVDDDGRFRLLETIRDYARHKLADAGEVVALRDRHLAFFLAMAVDAEPRLEGPDVFVVADGLEADHDNVRAAIDWAVESERADDAFRLVGALPIFWLLRDHLVEATDRVDQVTALEGGDDALRARALLAGSFGGGRIAGMAGRSRAQRAAGLELARRIGDRRTEGRLLLWEGRDAQRTGRSRAISDLLVARDVAEEVGDVWCLAEAESHIGIATMLGGDLVEARERFRRAIELCGPDGDPICRQRSALFRGAGETMFGHFDRGPQMLEGVLPQLRGSGDHYGVTLALSMLVMADTLRGDFAAARRRRDALFAMVSGSAYLDRIGTALYSSADLAYAEGRFDDARREAHEAIQISFAIDDEMGRALAAGVLSRVALIDDTPEVASQCVSRQLAWDEQAHHPAGVADAHLVAGRVALLRGELTTADEHLHAALAAMTGRGLLGRIADVIEAIGEVVLAYGKPTEATRLLAAAESVRVELGMPRFPVEQPRFDAAVAACREVLGDDAFEEASSEGSRLTLDETVEYVTRARRERGRPSHGWESLTPTEVQVVRLVREGLTNPQIAARLFNSPGTVRAHMSHIFAKVGVATRAELAAEATRRDI